MRDKLDDLREWFGEKGRSVWVEYGVLSLFILLPLLLPGYILTLDLVFTPHFAWPSELTNTYPLQAVLWVLYLVLPGDVIEKLILFMILLLSGTGMHLLVRRVRPAKSIGLDSWHMAAYFAGVFYMINPFTYSRFMAGQWMVLLGYALLPFFFLALLRLLAGPTIKTAMKLTVWAFAIITVSLHHLGIVALLAVIALVVGIVTYRGKPVHVRRLLGYGALSSLIVILVSSFWLVPAVFGQNGIGQAVASFDQVDFAAFATSGNGALGAIGEVIRLQGFWAEDRQLFLLPQSLMPVWGIVFLVMWIVIIIGSIKAWSTHRTLVIVGMGSITAGIVLAATPLIPWLSQFIPFIAGYREPHKFVNLIAFGYALLGAFGVAHLIKWATKRFNELGGQTAAIICLLLPLALAPTMLWGFAGQLSPRMYPNEWYDMNRILKDKAKGQRVLFLPWHQYQEYSFSGRIIANPAEKFFEVPMIISDEPEFQHVSPTVPSQEKRDISAALKHSENFPSTLIRQNVRFILLAKSEDKENFDYLDKDARINVLSENAKLKLYEVKDR